MARAGFFSENDKIVEERLIKANELATEEWRYVLKLSEHYLKNNDIKKAEQLVGTHFFKKPSNYH